MSEASTVSLGNELSEGYEPYRAISKAAVMSVVLGVISLVTFSFPALLFLPLIGLLAGWSGYRSIRRYPAELSGRFTALAGIALCGLVLVGCVSFYSITYATEVPDGYQRISFVDLQPLREHPDLPVSPKAMELSGKKIFIKGYVYPDGQQSNIKRFVLVPDMGTCCFGGQPKLTDMIEVTLTDPDRIKYSFQKRKLAGELLVDTQLKPVSGLGGVYFQLKAHIVN
jgi:hypothetical protein